MVLFRGDIFIGFGRNEEFSVHSVIDSLQSSTRINSLPAKIVDNSRDEYNIAWFYIVAILELIIITSLYRVASCGQAL